MARRASCNVANVFSTGLDLMWPRSSLKTTKMSKKKFLAKVPGVNGLSLTVSCQPFSAEKFTLEQSVRDLMYSVGVKYLEGITRRRE